MLLIGHYNLLESPAAYYLSPANPDQVTELNTKCLRRIPNDLHRQEVFGLSGVKLGSLRTIRILLETHDYSVAKPITFTTPNGRVSSTTNLHVAVIHGHVEVIKYLVNVAAEKEGKNEAVISSLDSTNSTIFFVACAYNNLDVAKFLWEAGADAERSNFHFVTPLHSAAHEGFYDVAKFLLEDAKVDADPRNDLDQTPLYYACLRRQDEVGTVDSAYNIHGYNSQPVIVATKIMSQNLSEKP